MHRKLIELTAVAEYLMEFCQEIGRYRRIAREIFAEHQKLFRELVDKSDKLEDVIFTTLRDQKNESLCNEFEGKTREFFEIRCEGEPDAVSVNTERIMKFLTDYKWWLGGKAISRPADWGISPISALLNMPQNDSNFISRAVSRAIDDTEYRNAFEHATECEWRTHDSVDEYTELVYRAGLDSTYERNRILFGAPGTGKSFKLNQEARDLLGEYNGSNYERVTFHPDYSYANFVGTYKPVMSSNQKGRSADNQADYVISVLNDKEKTAQEKYDLLYESFRNDGLTRLPILLGIYTDEMFRTKKADGSDAANDNSVERNHGRAIRRYVQPLTGDEVSGEIAYEYIPGPFMRTYVKALKNARSGKPEPYLLIIEEINRANVAAVFGDIFQLLDRDDHYISEYPIHASEDIKKYLARELGGSPDDYESIRIPDNMFIWATMNSANQGVFPIDTAFKRRWDFTYLGIDDNDTLLRGKYVRLSDDRSQKVEWNKLRKAINNFLANEKINEDKQLGPYFISKNVVVPDNGDEIDRDQFIRVFKSKVIMYLFEDAARQKRAKLFEGCFQNSSRYSEICKEFDEKGIGIFYRDIQIETDPEEPDIIEPEKN